MCELCQSTTDTTSRLEALRLRDAHLEAVHRYERADLAIQMARLEHDKVSFRASRSAQTDAEIDSWEASEAYTAHTEQVRDTVMTRLGGLFGGHISMDDLGGLGHAGLADDLVGAGSDPMRA
ncbi:hypothetical protein KBD20_02710 [Candidatus Saccharibacteria bacterium]|nr:hypothetical protein [Candidatus Saccharibacteria bacterium]